MPLDVGLDTTPPVRPLSQLFQHHPSFSCREVHRWRRSSATELRSTLSKAKVLWRSPSKSCIHFQTSEPPLPRPADWQLQPRPPSEASTPSPLLLRRLSSLGSGCRLGWDSHSAYSVRSWSCPLLPSFAPAPPFPCPVSGISNEAWYPWLRMRRWIEEIPYLRLISKVSRVQSPGGRTIEPLSFHLLQLLMARTPLPHRQQRIERHWQRHRLRVRQRGVFGEIEKKNSAWKLVGPKERLDGS